jgi:hypothetical protein
MIDDENKKILRKIIELHSNFVMPLFGMNGKDTKLRGTGFFVERGADRYLITANHVFDQKRFPGPVYVWCKEFEFIPVRGLEISTGDGGDEDPEDLRVVKLGLSFPFPPYSGEFKIRALDYSSLLPAKIPRDKFLYLLNGFPESQNELHEDMEVFNATLCAYDDASASKQKYDQLKLDPEKYLLINFDKRRTMERDGKKYSFPKAVGMSGSPIFLLHPDFQAHDGYRISVVGILTRTRKIVSAIQGTDIGIVIELIEKLDYIQNQGFVVG